MIENGEAYIAGDRAGSNGFTKMTCKDSKVFKKGDFIFGFAGSFRMGQIIKHKFDIPERGVHEDLEHYIYNKFIKGLKKSFKDNGYGIEKNEDKNGDVGGNFIFLIESRIFEMQGDFSILESKDDFTAIGSGEFHAMAAMAVLMEHSGLKPKEKLKEAMRVVSKFVMSVSEECDVLSGKSA